MQQGSDINVWNNTFENQGSPLLIIIIHFGRMHYYFLCCSPSVNFLSQCQQRNVLQCHRELKCKHNDIPHSFHQLSLLHKTSIPLILWRQTLSNRSHSFLSKFFFFRIRFLRMGVLPPENGLQPAGRQLAFERSHFQTVLSCPCPRSSLCGFWDDIIYNLMTSKSFKTHPDKALIWTFNRWD